MNSMPATSKARWISIKVEARLAGTASVCSKRISVRRLTPEYSARVCADQFRAALADRICCPVTIDSGNVWHYLCHYERILCHSECSPRSHQIRAHDTPPYEESHEQAFGKSRHSGNRTGLPALRRVWFLQANTSPSPVLGDKFDPCGFKCMSDREIIGGRQSCLTLGQFSAANSGDRDSRRPREVLGAPTN
jgi:hypothetical protein